ncbi:unnamed protein product [Sphagnum troendelagicum]|uniref:Uncharacterized protein n=1 Tax=Sphagnum troendelagicum TaxID=128251 RepID=A0ABP0TU31_9BRYO
MTTASATIQRPARDGALAFSLVLSAAVVAVPTPFPSAAREFRLLFDAAAALALAAIGPAAAATWEGAPAFEPTKDPAPVPPTRDPSLHRARPRPRGGEGEYSIIQIMKKALGHNY